MTALDFLMLGSVWSIYSGFAFADAISSRDGERFEWRSRLYTERNPFA